MGEQLTRKEGAGEDTATETVGPPQEAHESERDPIVELRGRIEHYELIRPLGRGGMGTVYLARDTRLGRLVGIKLVRNRRLASAERFRVEARATARCVHENIVVIHEIGEQSGYLYMVLEYLSGLTLKQWLGLRAQTVARGARASHVPAASASVPASRAIEIITPVVRAMECAHAHGIVHRDLKPSNIMLTDSGVIKVLDFGVAKLFEVTDSRSQHWPDETSSPELTGAGRLVGSGLYMSPEQWGVDEVDHRSDIWAVGIILYQLVTGQHPIYAMLRPDLREIADLDVPMPPVSAAGVDVGKLGSIIERCLIKRKADRIGTARELLAELEALPSGAIRRRIEEDVTPYAGLAAFEEGDADRFFGRSRDVAAVVARLREQPLMAIVGPSGAGKSSFVRAGVVPALKQSGDAWEALIIRPGRHPLAALAGLLLESPGTSRSTDTWSEIFSGERPIELDRDELCRRLRDQPGYFGTRLRARASRKLCRTLLFIDQFEELYTLGADEEERRIFAACLEGAADDAGSPLRVLVSIRSDFLDRTTEAQPLMNTLVRGLVLLPPIARDGLREILTRPLEEAGYRFETERMVEDMLDALQHTPSALPLLQFTASKLWESRDRQLQLLTETSYRAIGGVAGTLATHADAVLASMSLRDQALARQFFERLITPERTRALASVSELRELSPEPRDAERMLVRLVEARLLVVQADAEGDGSTVEIVHESLIESWPRLSRWLTEHQEDAAFVARLRSAAKEWRASGRPQGLLWRDEAMLEAQRWNQRADAETVGGEKEFLDAVFALARKTARRRRLSFAALIVCSLVVAAIMASLAWRERQAKDLARQQAAQTRLAAERARREAEHARDAARVASARDLEQDPTLALALLREVEEPERHRPWPALAATLVREPVAQAVLVGHEGVVWTAEFSPNGERLVTVSADTARVWNSNGTGEPIVLRGHTGPVWRATFSSDGRKILTASWDRTVRVWNADGTGAPVVLEQPDRISWASFSPDGQRVVTASWDRTAWVWKADGSGTPVVLRGHTERVRRADFSPDGTQVLTFSFDHTARVWNADGTGTPVVLRGHTDSVWAGNFSPDGTHVVTASSDGTARVWNADGTGAPVVLRGHTLRVRYAEFSPDGTRVVTASDDGTARVWNASGTGAPVILDGHGGASVHMAIFNSDGSQILTASNDKTARLWTANGLDGSVVLSGHERPVHWIGYSRDGKRIVTASGDRSARIWDARQPNAPVVLPGPRDLAPTISFSPDGQRLAASWRGDRHVWIWRTDGAGAPVIVESSAPIKHAQLSSDGRRVAGAGEDGIARVWNADGSGQPVLLRGHQGAIRQISFLRDGSKILTASDDGTARVWNADGSGVPVVLRGPGNPVLMARFSPDGSRVVTLCSDDSTARVWNADGSGTPILLRGHTNVLHWLDISFDSRHVLTASADNTARVWDLARPAEPVVLSGHTHEVRRAVFSADATRVVTASDDGTARIWRADGTGVPIILREHLDVADSAELSPDGRRVVTASQSALRVWNADGSGVPIILRGHQGSIFEALFSPDGTRVASAATDGTIRIWPNVSVVPTIPELREAMWKASSYCMPADLRRELLGVSEETASDEAARCRQRVAPAVPR